MKQYDYLLFDLDGTLLDFEAAQEQALRVTFQRYAIPFKEAIKKYYLELNANLWDAYEKGQYDRDEIVRKRFIDVFEKFQILEDGEQFGLDYQTALGEGHACIPNAMDVLKQLSNDYAMSIITNGTAKTQYQRIKESNLTPFFEYIFISDEIGYRKPMKAYFDHCLNTMKDVSRDQILIIGDSLSSDMLGGYDACMDTCWYNPKHKQNSEKITTTYEIDDLRDLIGMLKKGVS